MKEQGARIFVQTTIPGLTVWVKVLRRPGLGIDTRPLQKGLFGRRCSFSARGDQKGSILINDPAATGVDFESLPIPHFILI